MITRNGTTSTGLVACKLVSPLKGLLEFEGARWLNGGVLVPYSAYIRHFISAERGPK